MQNGNLILPPFRAEDYNQEVHAQTYRCIAENTFGKIQSRDVHVRAGIARILFLFGGKLFATGLREIHTETKLQLFVYKLFVYISQNSAVCLQCVFHFAFFATFFLLMPLRFKNEFRLMEVFIFQTKFHVNHVLVR